MENEIWKPLECWIDKKSNDEKEFYRNNYMISNLGNIKSLKNDKILNQVINPKGYSQCCLVYMKNGKKSYWNFRVHKAVALQFLNNPNNLPDLNHKDGNKQNNNVSNLEWIDNIGNMKHAFKNNLRFSSFWDKIEKIKCIETGKEFYTEQEAKDYYNIRSSGQFSEYLSHKIGKSRKGYYKSCGKNPINNDPLHWLLIDKNGDEYTPEEYDLYKTKIEIEKSKEDELERE